MLDCADEGSSCTRLILYETRCCEEDLQCPFHAYNYIDSPSNGCKTCEGDEMVKGSSIIYDWPEITVVRKPKPNPIPSS